MKKIEIHIDLQYGNGTDMYGDIGLPDVLTLNYAERTEWLDQFKALLDNNPHAYVSANAKKLEDLRSEVESLQEFMNFYRIIENVKAIYRRGWHDCDKHGFTERETVINNIVRLAQKLKTEHTKAGGFNEELIAVKHNEALKKDAKVIKERKVRWEAKEAERLKNFREKKALEKAARVINENVGSEEHRKWMFDELSKFLENEDNKQDMLDWLPIFIKAKITQAPQ